MVPDEDKFDRVALQEFVKRRFIYCPSFSIYGGQSGLYDFGPVGCTLKANFISLWRQHFVIEEGMLEVDATVLTPETVLCTSGHADRFVDFMVTDSTTGDFYRADHLLCNHLEKLLSDKKCPVDKRQEYERVMRLADSYGGEELAELFEKYDVKAALTGNDVTTPMEFNLMFKTSIGPGSGVAGYASVFSTFNYFILYIVSYARRQHRGSLSISSVSLSLTMAAFHLLVLKSARLTGMK